MIWWHDDVISCTSWLWEILFYHCKRNECDFYFCCHICVCLWLFFNLALFFLVSSIQMNSIELNVWQRCIGILTEFVLSQTAPLPSFWTGFWVWRSISRTLCFSTSLITSTTWSRKTKKRANMTWEYWVRSHMCTFMFQTLPRHH